MNTRYLFALDLCYSRRFRRLQQFSLSLSLSLSRRSARFSDITSASRKREKMERDIESPRGVAARASRRREGCLHPIEDEIAKEFA